MFALKGFKLNPFSTPSDSKLDFRLRAVTRLYSEHIPVTDDEVSKYWSLYWEVFDSSHDVLNLLTPQDVNKALLSYPKNITSLVRLTAERLEDIVRREPGFPAPPISSSGFTDYAGRLLSRVHADAQTGAAPDLHQQLLNCVRVLSRVIPHILAQEGSRLENDLFWSARSLHPCRQSRSSEEVSHFVIDENEDGSEPISATTAAHSQGISNLFHGQQSIPASGVVPLAEILVDLAVDLLFIRNFTLAADPAASGKAITYTVWENGIGSTLSQPVTRQVDHNRCEVLRFLLVLLSKTLYIPSNAFTHPHSATEDQHPFAGSNASRTSNRWHAYLVQPPKMSSNKKRKIQLSLLCSLLNTSLKSGAQQASGGGSLAETVGGAVGDGYEKLLSGGKRKQDSPRLALVKLCTQTLNALLVDPASDSPHDLERSMSGILLDERSGFSPPSSRSIDSGHQSLPNAFQLYLAKLHRPTDLTYIVENLMAILVQPMALTLLKLPFEVIGLAHDQRSAMSLDFLILLSTLIETNPRLLRHLLADAKTVHQIAAMLLYLCLEHKDDPAQLGIVKLSAFVLQTISAERGFGTNLNIHLHAEVPLPGKYAVPGTAADFVIQSIYILIYQTRGTLNTIYPAFILTITNISPYLKNPSVRSSTRLVQLFLSMSAPSFLLSDEANPRLAYYLLEAFNNVIQFQLSDCPNLVYAIIRSHQRFDALSSFTLASGVAEIRRARKQRSAKTSIALEPGPLSKAPRRPSDASLSSVPSLSVLIDEKATLASRESLSHDFQHPSQPASPAGEYPPVRAMSEKAAGKQRARSDSQVSQRGDSGFFGDQSGEDDDIADEPFISKTGFQPTENWVASWRDGLPIDAILVLISECLPKVTSLSSLSTDAPVIEYLRSTSLVGLLPASPPVKARPFVPSVHSIIWLCATAWGSTYVQSLDAFWVWRDTPIRLFFVKPRGPGGVQGVVTNLMGQGLEMFSTRSGALSPQREA